MFCMHSVFFFYSAMSYGGIIFHSAMNFKVQYGIQSNNILRLYYTLHSTYTTQNIFMYSHVFVFQI